MKKSINIISKLLLILAIFQTTIIATPQLTVVIVIDQFAYNYITKLKNHFNHGFKKLLNNGIVFTNAYHPHGAPTTATGHAAIGTGCFAKNHGIVLNGWYNSNGQKVRCFDDENENTKVFTLEGTQDYGKSTKNLMCDGLSDQFILASQPKEKHLCFSISNKPRAAMGMSGKLGKAIWFDEKTGLFTSSQAFFEKIPDWLIDFNKKIDLKNLKLIKWKLAYPENGKYYKFRNINVHKKNGFKFSAKNSSLINKNGIQIDSLDDYIKTPLANEHLLELAKTCMKSNFNPDKKEKMLLWISLSPLDKLGHVYGPNSLEITDMIYHLDKQIEDFLQFAQKKVGNKKLLFVLTADHGVEPITEIMNKDKYKQAIRIQYKPLIKKMNKIIEDKFGISKIVQGFKTTCFYLDRYELNKLEKKEKEQITKTLQAFIKQQPGVKNVWTFDELCNSTFKKSDLENFYKQQLYANRSGDLICQPHTYCTFTKYPTGTSHRSAYEYNTHVPLFIYQENKLEKKIIKEKVWIPQLTVTLSKLLKIQKPSASTFDVLPGV